MAKFNKDSVSGTVTVVVLLSLVCSIVVSGAAVALKSKQDEQKALDVQRNILTVAGLMKEDNASVIKDTYSKFIEPRLVDLQSGDYVQASAEEINKFEPKDAVKDPAKSQAIPAEADKAGIKVRANQARVYLVKDEQGNVTQVVLPMYGRGLWSTMYGFVSVAPDAIPSKVLRTMIKVKQLVLGAKLRTHVGKHSSLIKNYSMNKVTKNSKSTKVALLQIKSTV